MRRLFVLLLCVGACHTKAAPTMATPNPTGAVRFDTPRGRWVVKVEIVSTDAARERGLMFRRDLPQDTGMIFVFQTTEEHSFWMHNTLLALDMIFLGEDRKVAGVVTAAPQTDRLRSIQKPSRYVVEVSAGEAAAHAVGPGTPATFVDIPE